MKGQGMRYYIGIVRKDEDSSYGIEFPDLPGCFSAGETLEQLEAAAIEAIDLYLEGEDADLYLPRGMDQIVATVGAGGDHMLMSVPWLRPGGRTMRVNISIDQATLDAIDTAADRRKVTRSAFLADAARREILQGAGR